MTLSATEQRNYSYTLAYCEYIEALKASFPPVPVFNMREENDKETAIECRLSIRQFNNEVGRLLGDYFPFSLQFREKRAIHSPAPIQPWVMPSRVKPSTTTIPDAFTRILVNTKQGKVEYFAIQEKRARRTKQAKRLALALAAQRRILNP